MQTVDIAMGALIGVGALIVAAMFWRTEKEAQRRWAAIDRLIEIQTETLDKFRQLDAMVKMHERRSEARAQFERDREAT